MYKLYGYRGSGSAAVEMALRAVNAQYEVIEVASWDPGNRIEELASINPLLQIPALVLPDGTVLTESAAILMYLADSHPDAGIIPVDMIMRARTVQGVIYIAANCYTAVGIVDFPERWTEAVDDAELDNIRVGTRKRLYQQWEIFTDLFEPVDGLYLDGERPGILDFMAVTVSRFTGARKHLHKRRPGFHQYLQRVEAVPPVSDVVRQHWVDR